MQYMILIHSEPFDAPAPGDPGFEELMAPWMEYKNKLVEGGHFVAAEQLQGTETATTIRRANDAGDTIVDGPFAETKEHLGGFYIVEAKDLDEALTLAAAVPIPAGSLEVRPVVPA
ncbi:YciI family protein [Rhodoglobus aureus]|uniref:YciI family protein n=1 Tax=Rhodoglobus aureus TaxID=191497 RepID=A0ABN1VMW3_9MICO